MNSKGYPVVKRTGKVKYETAVISMSRRKEHVAAEAAAKLITDAAAVEDFPLGHIENPRN